MKCCIAHAEKTGVLLDVGNVPRFDDEKEEAVELPDFNDIVVRSIRTPSFLRYTKFYSPGKSQRLLGSLVECQTPEEGSIERSVIQYSERSLG